MTEKLYYSDGECRAFTARVVSCEAENGAYCVVLDRTAVFPGGGGQEPDSGSLNGLPIIALREAERDHIPHPARAAGAGQRR